MSDKLDLNALEVFAAVAESGGFTAAADRLGLSKARVSLEVGRLEARLGLSLFNRTTRRVVLTDAGETVLARCVPLLREAHEVLEALSEGDGAALTGVLRITLSVDFAVQLAPLLVAFSARHPALQLDLRTSDRVVDLVQEGVDVGLRVGWLRDSTLRAVRLGSFEQYVLAAPAYLAEHAAPSSPEALADHAWIALTLLRSPLTWTFRSPAGEERTVRMKARLRTDSGMSLRALLQQGAGVSILDQLSAEAGLRVGTLVRLLPDWSLPSGGVYAVFPPGRHMPAKVRALIAFLREDLVSRSQDDRQTLS